MIYQKILMNDAPYDLTTRPLIEFVEHRHADMEFNYFARGSRKVIIDKKSYEICEGQVVVIAPGASHEFPRSDDPGRLVLTGVMGTSFLKKYFSAFSSSDFRSSIIDLNSTDERKKLLKDSLDNIISLLETDTIQSSLLITGELYKICAYFLDNVTPVDMKSAKNGAGLEALARIDGALQLIYYEYKRKVTVDEAANITGYGKSNFCRIFKNTTGMNFHEALNRRRIDIACGLLTETGLSVSEISEEVGFDEAKTFCRVFKEKEGISPGAYRRNKRNKSII